MILFYKNLGKKKNVVKNILNLNYLFVVLY